jgi:aspartyl/glutamyl-tRNA(Asn/Gln) amidotransferase C subunit
MYTGSEPGVGNKYNGKEIFMAQIPIEHIHDEELQRLARTSRLAIGKSSARQVMREIDDILTYIDLLAQAKVEASAQLAELSLVELSRCMRADGVMPYAGPDLVAAAPGHESGYFVVPAILASEK